MKKLYKRICIYDGKRSWTSNINMYHCSGICYKLCSLSENLLSFCPMTSLNITSNKMLPYSNLMRISIW